MFALEINNIVKKYTNHLALDGVSLNIPKESIFGLLGPNGAGKTTLIRIINQIVHADKGEIYIEGELLNSKHISVVGYLPEERGLYKKMSVGEQLVFLGQLRNLTRSQSIKNGRMWCEKLGISELWKKNVEVLSKGMAQKVQFISTVINNPKIIILDEPFSGFDPVNANLITEQILELKNQGSTIIFSTHRMESVEALCDYIALINDAKVILSGEKLKIQDSYKNNTYVLVHEQELGKELNMDVEIKNSRQLRNQLYETTIQLRERVTANQLLSELIKFVEVRSFYEKTPSIGEIFISKVKETNR